MTFAEWEAQRKAGTPQRPSEGVAQDEASPDATEPERYHPGLSDTPTSAYAKELGRTAMETGIGIAKSPLDLLSGLLHPIDSLSSTAHAITHPVETVKAIGDNPRMGGSMIGQLLLAPKLPEVARGIAENAPPVVGRTMAATGRGMEAVGKSTPLRAAASLGPLEAVARGDWKGLAAAALPPSLEWGGRALQSVGEKIANTDVLQGLARAARRVTPGETLTEPTAADSMRTTVETARNLEQQGMSRAQANQRAGYSVTSTESPVPAHLPSEYNDFNFEKPTRSSLQGLRQATYRPPMEGNIQSAVETTARQMGITPEELDARITGQLTERRTAAGRSPTGVERRVTPDEPLSGTVAERAARMRQENPNIDQEAKLMRKLAELSGRKK